MKTAKCALAVVLGLIGLAVPRAARADAVYTYTGTPFTVFVGDSCLQGVGECQITGSFSVLNPIAPGSVTLLVTPSSYSFTDGTTVFDNNNSTIGILQISTDATTGQINQWLVEFINGTDSIYFASVAGSDCSQGCSPYTDKTYTGPTTGSVGGYAFNANFTLNQLNQYNPPIPGTWSGPPIAPVPESSSLVLLGTGLLGVVGVMRRKRLA